MAARWNRENADLRRTDDGGWPCRGRDRRSAGSEEGALVLPGDGESDLVREALRGQLDGMPVTQDGLDDVRR